MTLWDANILVSAFRQDSPLHAVARNEVERGLTDRTPFLFCPFLVASFVRLVTNPKVFVQPSDAAEAWRSVDHLESHPGAVFADTDEQTYALFRHLCLVNGSAGNRVPDALLAATALRHDARLVTADTGFTRYPGVDVSLIR